MNAHNDNDETLALLRDLPVEVSLEQVAHMVAAFPLAVGTVSWLTTLKTNLNTILMISIGTIIIGTAIYFMPAGASETRTPMETKLPEINSPAPVVDELQVETTQPAGMSVLPVADTSRAPAPSEPVTQEPMPPTSPTPLSALPASPVVPGALLPPAPVPNATPKQTGDTSTKTYALRDFSAVASFTSADVFVEEGPWSVTAIGDPKQLERLEVNVEKGVLKITMKKDKRSNYNTWQALKLEVYMPQVTRLEQQGSGDIKVGDLSGGKSLALTAMGSGDIVLKSVKSLAELTLLVQGSGDINCLSAIISGHTSATVLGSGDVKASGSTGTLEVMVQGSGNVDLSGMKSQSGNVSVLGSGDVIVNCTGPLEQLIHGSGTIRNVDSAGGAGKSDEE